MRTETISKPGYKNALNCKKCPQSNDEKGCPVWLETTMTNVQTGENILQKGCGFQMVPLLLVSLAKVEDTRAGEISQMRKEVVERVGDISLMYLDKHVKANQISSQPNED